MIRQTLAASLLFAVLLFGAGFVAASRDPVMLITAFGSTVALDLRDSASRGLPITPQMFGARCDSTGAAGNGTDDTLAFQNAELFAEAQGLTLKVPGQPQGRMCRLTAPIQPKRRVIIEGDYCQPYRHLDVNATTPGGGSWLFFDHSGPGIWINGVQPYGAVSGFVIRNICTYRAQPPFVKSGPWTPGNFDYDISIAGDDTRIEHVTMLNPTRGIYIVGRFTIDDVRGSPYQIGINVQLSADESRLLNIHFWPFSSINLPAEVYKRHNLEALLVGRWDNPIIEGFFAIAAKYCIHLVYHTDAGQPQASGVANKIKATNVDCDQFGVAGLFSEAPGATGQFANFTTQGADPEAGDPAPTSGPGILIATTNNHFVFSGVRVTYVGADAVTVNGVGNWLVLNGYMAENWGMNVAGCAASANDGATVTIGPGQLFGPNGTHGSCLYGGNATVNAITARKVN